MDYLLLYKILSNVTVFIKCALRDLEAREQHSIVYLKDKRKIKLAAKEKKRDSEKYNQHWIFTKLAQKRDVSVA